MKEFTIESRVTKSIFFSQRYYRCKHYLLRQGNVRTLSGASFGELQLRWSEDVNDEL